MNRVEVKPELLYWARERSGQTADYLHDRFPKLHAWERGSELPTLKQLEDFAKATHTPIGYLFLEEPPLEKLPIADFRTIGGVGLSRPSPDLLETLYLCQQRQDWYREEAHTTGESPLALVGSMDTSTEVSAAGARLREALAFDIDQRREAPTWSDALRQFIGQADALGILVMVSGIVGSNTHRKLDPEEFRGFVLSDPLAPLVFINGADTKAAQMFTLAHEIAHLCLGDSGLLNPQAIVIANHHATEHWCNRVAAELLLPAALARKEFDQDADLNAESNRLARIFKVSTLVVLRRIYDVGGLNHEDFQSAYTKELNRLRVLQKAQTGGNAISNVGSRVSKRLARALVLSTLEGRTSYTESFRLLGVGKMSTFEKVAKSLGVVA